jgi:hypothetical protein
MIHAADSDSVAGAAGKIESQIARMPFAKKARCKAFKHKVWRDPSDDADACDGLAILDRRNSFFRRTELIHSASPRPF